MHVLNQFSLSHSYITNIILCVTIINCTIQVVNINTGYCVIADQSCVKNSSCVDTINPGFGW